MNRRSDPKRYVITDSLYKTALVLLIGGDRNKYMRSRICVKEDFLAPSKDARCEGMYFRIHPQDNTEGNNCSVIWLKIASIPLLVHELTHFCNEVFRDCGIDRSSRNDEAYAYYLEHCVRQVLEKVPFKVKR